MQREKGGGGGGVSSLPETGTDPMNVPSRRRSFNAPKMFPSRKVCLLKQIKYNREKIIGKPKVLFALFENDFKGNGLVKHYNYILRYNYRIPSISLYSD